METFDDDEFPVEREVFDHAVAALGADDEVDLFDVDVRDDIDEKVGVLRDLLGDVLDVDVDEDNVMYVQVLEDGDEDEDDDDDEEDEEEPLSIPSGSKSTSSNSFVPPVSFSQWRKRSTGFVSESTPLRARTYQGRDVDNENAICRGDKAYEEVTRPSGLPSREWHFKNNVVPKLLALLNAGVKVYRVSSFTNAKHYGAFVVLLSDDELSSDRKKIMTNDDVFVKTIDGEAVDRLTHGELIQIFEVDLRGLY